jgi:hypothetical protein
MRTKEAEDAARRRPRKRSRRDTGRLADRLAPPEERRAAGAGQNGGGTDDTIRLNVEDQNPAGGLLDEEDGEHGRFYMQPVVAAAFGLLLVYTIFVAVLIAFG